MVNARNAWGFSLFCDDLRQEIGGKYSLMGIFENHLLIPSEFPCAFAKFVIVVKYYELKGMFDNDLEVNISLVQDEAEKLLISQTIKRADFPITPDEAQLDQDSEPIYSLTTSYVFSPLVLEKESHIKVRIKCGSVITKLGRLLIRKISLEDNVQLA